MSSNTSKGRAEKGSKFWMQMVPNTGLKQQMDKLLNDNLTWICPLKGNNSEYLEYELSHPDVCARLGIQDPDLSFSFWPKRQPQWDGLAVSEQTSTLYLIEAKAHLKELESKCMASEKSKPSIEKAMHDVYEAHYSGGNFDQWMTGFYQLGNRLTFLQKMKSMGLEKYPNVKLILLNFVNDYTYKPTSLTDWQKHFEEVFEAVVGDASIPDDVILAYYDVAGVWSRE